MAERKLFLDVQSRLRNFLELIGVPVDDWRDATAQLHVYSRLTVLDDRRKEILIRRYGLKDGFTQSLAVVGRAIGISRQRVGQLQDDALDRLRQQAYRRGRD